MNPPDSHKDQEIRPCCDSFEVGDYCHCACNKKLDRLTRDNERMRKELVIAKGLYHDALSVSCVYCGESRLDYDDSMHKKDCKYLEALEGGE